MSVLELIKAVFIGIVQGVTEWLPISSTGHMILFDEFFKLDVTKSFMDMFLVVVQLGSILAVVYLYFNRLNPFSAKKTITAKKETLSLWGKAILGCIPAVIVGLLLDDVIHEKCYNPIVVAVMLIFYGVLFIVIENRNKKPTVKTFNQLTYKTVLLIGLFQMLALVPGTSRSGATIVGAMILGTSRFVAAEYSFFLAVPVMFGASGYEILKYVLKGELFFSPNEWLTLLVGTITAFLVSVVAIKFLMNYIKRHDFKVFGYYRIILGVLILLYFCLVK